MAKKKIKEIHEYDFGDETILIIDRATVIHSKTCRMIRRSEFAQIYPEKGHQRRIANIFQFQKPEAIPAKEALFLERKFKSLELLDERHRTMTPQQAIAKLEGHDHIPDDLDDMKYHDMTALAREMGITKQSEWQIKKVDLAIKIRALRKEAALNLDKNQEE